MKIIHLINDLYQVIDDNGNVKFQGNKFLCDSYVKMNKKTDKNVQVVKISTTILDYFKIMMDFDNKSQEYRDVTENEFKEELTKALNCGVANKEIKWV
jgi:hypothetical protein